MHISTTITTGRLKTASAPMPVAQEPDALKENIALIDFMMQHTRGKIGGVLLCLLAGFAESPESLAPTIEYMQRRYLS